MELTESVSKHYEKFFAKFKEIETKNLQSWNKIDILAYLCKRYREHYGIDFTFSFKAVPSKSREVFEMTKLSQMISSDPQILKSYVDWVFNSKIIEKKKRIGSLGYFTHPDLINEYKFQFLFNKKIDRTTQLETKYIEACKNLGYDIETYGELAFIVQGNDARLSSALTEAGLNLSLLETIK